VALNYLNLFLKLKKLINFTSGAMFEKLPADILLEHALSPKIQPLTQD